MKIPFSWLTEYCDPGLTPDEVAELLSMRAIEVERVSQVRAPAPDGFVVGRVLSANQHPDADRLRVCEVDTGDGTRTIVCGAPNVAAGQTVAVALPGAVMPGGQKLGAAKLRGVESAGMILSERELELSDEHQGIIELSPADTLEAAAGSPGPELTPGTPLAEVLPVSEAVLELDLNPNRPDCLGVYGVAREVHAITGAPLAPAPWEQDAEPVAEGSADELAAVTVEVPELCPRFTARVFTGVEMGPSPLWLKARLTAAGQRPISNVVDVTNYVMLLIGQPLHAFDLDKVAGGELIVRSAAAGERMTTLDGVTRELDAETVLVCDRNGPAAIAGIMGGQASEVSESTTRVLLEVASWNGPNILRSAAELGLRSDASARFEKQLHPELAIWAQRVASRLLAATAGAAFVPGTIDVAAEIPPPHVISLAGARLDGLLGVEIPRDEVRQGLERLGFAVEERDDELELTVPVHRHYDVSRSADIIEEVGRLHGFDRLPRRLPAHAERIGGLTREQRLRRRAEDVMAALGFDETVSWHLTPEDLAERLLIPDELAEPSVATWNPISAEHVRMRTTLLGGLLDAAQRNLARGAERVGLFESGRAYFGETAPGTGGPVDGVFRGRRPAPAREPHRIGALLVGGPVRPGWRGDPAPGDFFTIKGVLETLAAHFDAPVTVRAEPRPFLHPGRAATVSLGGRDAGWIGELHPLVCREWDIPGAAGFEFDLGALISAAPVDEPYRDVTTHPAVLQDIAVVVPEATSAEQILAAVRRDGGELLSSVELFDVYRGEQAGEGNKSVALRLEFRSPDRTLTDDEVRVRREAISEGISAIGGALRD